MSESERLYNALVTILGTDWNGTITVQDKVHNLYWLVHLAEAGIQARQMEWRYAKLDKSLNTAEAASIVSWKESLQDFIAQIVSEAGKAAPTKRGKK